MSYPLRIEVSQNDGVSYTKDALSFIYRDRDVMSSISPAQGFVNGNTLLSIGTTRFYNFSSSRAVCLFESLDGLNTFFTRIINYNATHIFCFTPPSYLVDPTLSTSGGNVSVYISSNNRDFSEEQFNFTYLPTVIITSIDPLWIVNSIPNQKVSIIGDYFFSTPYL